MSGMLCAAGGGVLSNRASSGPYATGEARVGVPKGGLKYSMAADGAVAGENEGGALALGAGVAAALAAGDANQWQMILMRRIFGGDCRDEKEGGVCKMPRACARGIVHFK